MINETGLVIEGLLIICAMVFAAYVIITGKE